MRWLNPRDGLHVSRSMRSSVLSANRRHPPPRLPPKTVAAERYADTNIAFQLTYIVRSMYGVGRPFRTESIFSFAPLMARRTLDSSRLRVFEISRGSRATHKTFLAGLWCISPCAS